MSPMSYQLLHPAPCGRRLCLRGGRIVWIASHLSRFGCDFCVHDGIFLKERFDAASATTAKA